MNFHRQNVFAKLFSLFFVLFQHLSGEASTLSANCFSISFCTDLHCGTIMYTNCTFIKNIFLECILTVQSILLYFSSVNTLHTQILLRNNMQYRVRAQLLIELMFNISISCCIAPLRIQVFTSKDIQYCLLSLYSCAR